MRACLGSELRCGTEAISGIKFRHSSSVRVSGSFMRIGRMVSLSRTSGARGARKSFFTQPSFKQEFQKIYKKKVYFIKNKFKHLVINQTKSIAMFAKITQ